MIEDKETLYLSTEEISTGRDQRLPRKDSEPAFHNQSHASHVKTGIFLTRGVAEKLSSRLRSKHEDPMILTTSGRRSVKAVSYYILSRSVNVSASPTMKPILRS